MASIYRLKELYRRKPIKHSFGHLPFVRMKACVWLYNSETKCLCSQLSCITSRMPHLTNYHYTKQTPPLFSNALKLLFIHSKVWGTFLGSNLRLSHRILSFRLSTRLAYSCIFHPCIFTCIAFSTSAFSVARLCLLLQCTLYTYSCSWFCIFLNFVQYALEISNLTYSQKYFFQFKFRFTLTKKTESFYQLNINQPPE